MQRYSIGIQNGFMCPNDVRELENLDLIPDELGGNKYMVNGNMVDLKNVGAAYSGGPVIKKEGLDSVLQGTDRYSSKPMDSSWQG